MKKLITLTLITLTLINTPSYANTLNSTTRIEDTIITAVENNKTIIDVSKFNTTPTESLNICLNLRNTEPEMWNVSNKVNIETKGNKTNKITVTYDYNNSDKNKIQSEIDKNVAEIAIMANDLNSDYEKAKFVYDYLIDNYDYDFTYSRLKEHELFRYGTGVCSAFSLAYKDILQELNIPCKIVVSQEMGHQWNIIQLEGEWYNVDVAWGDMYGNNYKSSCFAKSDLFFEMLGHTGGKAEDDIKCTNRKYDLEV